MTSRSTALTHSKSTPTPGAPPARVLIVDDVLATGGTAERHATTRRIAGCARSLAFSFLMSL